MGSQLSLMHVARTEKLMKNKPKIQTDLCNVKNVHDQNVQK